MLLMIGCKFPDVHEASINQIASKLVTPHKGSTFIDI